MKTELSSKESLKVGFNTAKQNFWYFAGLIVILIVISAIFDQLTENDLTLSWLFSLIEMVIDALIAVGLIKISFDFLDGRKPPFNTLYSEHKQLFSYFLASIVYGLMSLLAIVPFFLTLWSIFFAALTRNLSNVSDSSNSLYTGLYIDPDRTAEIGLNTLANPFSFILLLLALLGIYLLVKYQYYGYFIVDDNAGPLESLKKSGEITKGNWWSVFCFDLKMIGYIILGVIALLIGIFWAIPTVMVANAHFFRQLKKNAGI